MHKLFDDGEDRAFSRTVLRYNSMAEGSLEKLELENKVRERTKLLLYLINRLVQGIKADIQWLPHADMPIQMPALHEPQEEKGKGGGRHHMLGRH